MSDAFLDGISIEQWEERWAERLSGDEPPPVRVAVRDGLLVGFCIVATPSHGFRHDGWRVVSLWVVEGNGRAQKFYQRFGFEFDGASTSHKASGAREVRMRLPLTAGVAV